MATLHLCQRHALLRRQHSALTSALSLCTINNTVTQATTSTSIQHSTTLSSNQPQRSIWAKTRREIPRRSPFRFEQVANQRNALQDARAKPTAELSAEVQKYADGMKQLVEGINDIKQRYHESMVAARQQGNELSDEIRREYRSTLREYRRAEMQGIILPHLPAITVSHPHPAGSTPPPATQQFSHVVRGKHAPAQAVYDPSIPDVGSSSTTQPTTGDSFVVVDINGNQFKCSSGDLLQVDRLDVDVGSELVLDRVLLYATRDQTVIGRPLVQHCTVHASIEEHTQTGKILVFKMKRRKNYRKMHGHRSDVTFVRINDIKYSSEAASSTTQQPVQPSATQQSAQQST